MEAQNLIIYISPVNGDETRVESVCTLRQAVTLAKKEARRLLANGSVYVMMNILVRASCGVKNLAHIEAEKQGHRVVFSDESNV